jgi:hypothetical protein
LENPPSKVAAADQPFGFDHAARPHVHGMSPGREQAHLSSHDGCSDQPAQRKTARHLNRRRTTMTKIIQTRTSHVLSAAIALATLATVSLSAAPASAAVVTHVGYVNPAAPVAVNHYGYTRVTPYGVKHVGYTRVWR